MRLSRVIVLGLGLVVACGTPPPDLTPDAGPCVAYAVPVDLNLMNPVRSFTTDVMPILNQHCGSSSCHGSSNPTGGVFLGDTTKHGSDASTVHDALVGKPTTELASMNFVTTADLTRSYLMHKLDGDQCTLQPMCKDADCHVSMPSGLGLLAVESRDIVREWIAQGAAMN